MNIQIQKITHERDINKEHILVLKEDNESFQVKNRKWISKLDQEIENNSVIVSNLTKKLKLITDEKCRLEFQLKQTVFNSV
jgi:hypothetical protein